LALGACRLFFGGAAIAGHPAAPAKLRIDTPEYPPCSRRRFPRAGASDGKYAQEGNGFLSGDKQNRARSLANLLAEHCRFPGCGGERSLAKKAAEVAFLIPISNQ